MYVRNTLVGCAETCGIGLFYRSYRPLLQETGWLGSDSEVCSSRNSKITSTKFRDTQPHIWVIFNQHQSHLRVNYKIVFFVLFTARTAIFFCFLLHELNHFLLLFLQHELNHFLFLFLLHELNHFFISLFTARTCAPNGGRCARSCGCAVTSLLPL